MIPFTCHSFFLSSHWSTIQIWAEDMWFIYLVVFIGDVRFLRPRYGYCWLGSWWTVVGGALGCELPRSRLF